MCLILKFLLPLQNHNLPQIFIPPHTHTVGLWTFTFHKKSPFEKVILKANFKQGYRPEIQIYHTQHDGVKTTMKKRYTQNSFKIHF